MITLTDKTPYSIGFDESSAINIGGDARRCICFYNSSGSDCNGTYTIWGKKDESPWVQIGDAVTLSAAPKGYAITGYEVFNTFTKIYVNKETASNATHWFMVSGGRRGAV